MSVEINKRGFVLLILFILLFIGIYFKLTGNIAYNPIEKPKTAGYETISPEDVISLYKNTKNLIIIDSSQPKEVYREGHLPDAVWTSNPKIYYNKANTFLVYSNDDTIAKNFCEQLVDNVSGHIYFMPGGYEAWKNQ